MSQKLSGGCACGSIRYECNTNPVLMFNCHCRDCQRASGSAYAAILVMPKAEVQVRGSHVKIKSSGSLAKPLNAGFARAAVVRSW